MLVIFALKNQKAIVIEYRNNINQEKLDILELYIVLIVKI